MKISQLKLLVSSRTGVSVEAMESRAQHFRTVKARALVAWLARKQGGRKYSYAMIGKHLRPSGIDHSTLIKNMHMIRDDRCDDPDFRRFSDEVLEDVRWYNEHVGS